MTDVVAAIESVAPEAAGGIAVKQDVLLPLPEDTEASRPVTTPLRQRVLETIELFRREPLTDVLMEEAETMALDRERIRESIERAGDEHWEALVRHHTDVYPESNPTPGDVCRAEAARLNDLGLGDNPNLELVQSRVERIPPAVRITHVFDDRETGTQFETEPFTNYE